MLQLIFSVEDKKREYARKATQRRVGQLDGIFGIKHPELVKATSSRGVAVRMVVVGTVESESIWSTCHGFSSWTITPILFQEVFFNFLPWCFSMPKMFNSSCPIGLHKKIARSTSRKAPPVEEHLEKFEARDWSVRLLHSFTHILLRSNDFSLQQPATKHRWRRTLWDSQWFPCDQ